MLQLPPVTRLSHYRPIDYILYCAFHPRDLLMYLSLPLLLILEAASYEMGRRASPGVRRDWIVGSRHFLLCQLSRYYCPFHPVEGQQLESEFKTATGQLHVSENGRWPDRGANVIRKTSPDEPRDIRIHFHNLRDRLLKFKS